MPRNEPAPDAYPIAPMPLPSARRPLRLRRASAPCVGLLLAGLLGSTPAHGGEAEARSFFAEGRQKRLAGQCAEAVPLFRKAIEVYPDGLGSLRNLAECEEELGRFASARRDYWDLRLAALKSSDPKYAGWDRDATEAHARLASRVAKLRLTAKGPRDARVFLNGTPFDPRLYGMEVEQDLGKLEAELRDGSSTTKKAQLMLEEGKTYELSLVSDLPAEEPSLGATPPGDAGGEKQQPPPGGGTTDVAQVDASGLRTGGIVALVVAGAAGVGLGVSLGVRGGALSTVEDGCTPAGDGFVCPPELEGDVDTGNTTSTLATVFGVTAGVGAVAGVGMLVGAAMMSGPAERDLAFDVAPTLGGGYVGLRGRFW